MTKYGVLGIKVRIQKWTQYSSVKKNTNKKLNIPA
jgi:ribosomal protein S3